MIEYPKHATTVIGAYSVPDWFEPLDRLPVVGQLSTAAMTDAQFRATPAAVLDQELAGIDVITRWEMQRRTHDRHSPPNAMLNHFWQRINAFQGSTRPKPTAWHDPDGFHPADTCKGRVEEHIDLLGNKPIGIGAVDVEDPNVESTEAVVGRVRAKKRVAPDQTMLTSSCGFNHLPRRTAMDKMLVLADAKRALGG